MARKILILRWSGSAYDSLGGLLELVAREFAAQGLSVVLFAADGPDWPKRVIPLLNSGEIGFALTMSGIGVEAAVDGTSLWDVARVPLFNWSCDHPCYFPRRHTIRSRHVLHGYVFPDHARYNLRHLKPNGVAYAVHLGMPPRSVFGPTPLPAERRNGRIVFTKSGGDTNAIEAQWHGFGPELAPILLAGAEALMHRATGDFIPVLQEIAAARGLFIDGNSGLAMLLCAELDKYIRFRRADLVLRTLLAYPVDVFGSGWDHIDWDNAAAGRHGARSRARYYGAVTWPSMLERLPLYSGCLSTNPLIDESVHDRVFFALAAGVPPISDGNAFSRAHLPGLEPYAFGFTPERISGATEALLDDPAAAIERTEAAWQALTPSFSLRRSANQIVNFVALHGLNTPAGG